MNGKSDIGKIRLLVFAAVALWPWAWLAGNDELAPLVKEEGKEGTREACLAFTYRKTEDKRSETKGGRLNVGADKVHERTTIQTSGRAVVVVEDRDYLELRVLREDGPDGQVLEIPMPELLMFSWMASERATELGVKSMSRQTTIGGRRLYEHFAMNVWGPEDPRWYRETGETTGNDSLNWQAGKVAGKLATDLLHFSLSSANPENTLSFTYVSGSDATVDKWEIPPQWTDHHYRDSRPRHTTSNHFERMEVTLPSWEQEKTMPGDDKDRWSRVVQRSKTGVRVTATRTKTLAVPPDGPFLGENTRIDERLDVDFDLAPADYEIVITPPADLKEWIPDGGSDLRVGGSKLDFKGRVCLLKGAAAADRKVEVNVELTSSRVPGLCMNWPRQGDREPDLKILRANTTDKLKIEAPDLADEEMSVQRAHGSFGVNDEFHVVVGCFDFGPHGEISFGGSVPVRVEGHEPRVFVKLPVDENDNRVCDAWERAEGVFDKKLPADWDDVAVEGQKNNGDGICLYERYRGFMNSTGGYTRLKCDRKYLFLHDPANILREHGASDNFMKASKIVPIFISAEQWTGPGSHNKRKRIVNFNHEGVEGAGPTHRVDQHALDIFVDNRQQPYNADVPPPPGWQQAYDGAGVKPPPPDEEATLGYGWPDCLPVELLGRSPLDKYQIRIYPDTIRMHASTLAVLAMPGATEEDKAKALRDLLAGGGKTEEEKKAREQANKDLEAQVERLLQWTLCHELGHGVGAQHHVPIHGGDLTCYMRYPAGGSYTTGQADPFWNEYKNWPTDFCRGGSALARNSCYQHLQVTDRRDK